MANKSLQLSNCPEKASCSTAKFWEKIEHTLGFTFPTYIKNLLRLTGFDNPLSIRKLTEANLDWVEKFSKENIKFFLYQSDHLEEFYGMFHRCPERFQIVEGHKIMILEMVKFLDTTPIDYFSEPEKRGYSEEDSEQTNANLDQAMRPIKWQKLNSSSSSMDIGRLPIHSAQDAMTIIQLQKHIRNMAETWIKANLRKENSKEGLILNETWLEHLKVKVSIHDIPDEGGLGYRAEISCPMCEGSYQAHNVKVRGSETNKRWIISNFQKHMKNNHMLDRDKKTTTRHRSDVTVTTDVRIKEELMSDQETSSPVSDHLTYGYMAPDFAHGLSSK